MPGATLQQKLTRIIPTDVLESADFKDLIDVFRSNDAESVDPDPVRPMTMSPTVLVDPKTRFFGGGGGAPIAKTAAVAATAVVAASGSSWPSWANWKVAVGVLLGAFTVYMVFKNWRMARELGFSYALCAALPPLRPVVAFFRGTTSDNLYAEIEAYQLGVHPIQRPPPLPAPAPAPEPTPAPAPEPKEEKSRSDLMSELLDQVV
jgi:hypothetical protein